MQDAQYKVDWWIKYFRDEYAAKNGRDCSHLLIPGRTGAGKTTVMYWIFDAIVQLCMKQNGSSGFKDTIVWFDTGKSSEALTLLSMGPVRFLYPRGMKLDIKINPDCPVYIHEFEKVEMDDPMNPWKYLKKNWINVLCFKAYIIEPQTYSAMVASMLKKLIRLAHNKQIIVPLTLFIDEIQEIAPSVGHAFDKQHEDAAKWMAMNMKMVRSLGIRIIGATHDPYELRKGVRKEMAWQFPKQGVNYDRWEEPKLSRFNEKVWGHLNAEKEGVWVCIVRPDRMFSDPFRIEYYPRGEGFDGIGEMITSGEVDEDLIKDILKKRTEKQLIGATV